MKKSLLILTFVCAAAFFMTGCVTSYRDGGADGLYRPVSNGSSNYYTEYDISSERKSGNGSASILFWIFQFSEGKYCLLDSNPNITLLGTIAQFLSPTQVAVSNAKKAALFNVLSEINADQLLGTIYEYTVTNYLVFTKVECKVKGFPATAKAVKTIDKKPIILNRWQKLEYIDPQYSTPVDFSSGNFGVIKTTSSDGGFFQNLFQ